jgi:Protein of unknown function (DUF3606)
MSNLTKRASPDRSKIDVEDENQVKYWTKALGISKDDLLEAIDKVGNALPRLGKNCREGDWSCPMTTSRSSPKTSR